VIAIITEIRAVPSPMQWWMRAISALPPVKQLVARRLGEE